jgi:DNA-3-methyladenine glycosylase I
MLSARIWLVYAILCESVRLHQLVIISAFQSSFDQDTKAFLKFREEFVSFDAYNRGFVDGVPIQNQRKSMSELPAKTELSEEISKDLKKRGFNFVGPTIIYAFMQAVGIVNDHTVDCFRYHEIAAMGE